MIFTPLPAGEAGVTDWAADALGCESGAVAWPSGGGAAERAGSKTRGWAFGVDTLARRSASLEAAGRGST